MRRAPSVSAQLPSSALYEQVAERLRGQILSHELAPGSWIDEQALTAAYGISRTPLREALKVLAAEGLVTMKLRRGAFVATVSESELAEVFHLMALLEGDAAAVVAADASDSGIAELQQLHDEIEAHIDDRDAFFAANDRFHVRLLELANNRWRIQFVADLRRVMKLNRHQSLFRQGRLDASLHEHRQLMQALRARDADAARHAMQDHITAGRDAAAAR